MTFTFWSFIAVIVGVFTGAYVGLIFIVKKLRKRLLQNVNIVYNGAITEEQRAEIQNIITSAQKKFASKKFGNVWRKVLWFVKKKTKKISLIIPKNKKIENQVEAENESDSTQVLDPATSVSDIGKVCSEPSIEPSDTSGNKAEEAFSEAQETENQVLDEENAERKKAAELKKNKNNIDYAKMLEEVALLFNPDSKAPMYELNEKQVFKLAHSVVARLRDVFDEIKIPFITDMKISSIISTVNVFNGIFDKKIISKGTNAFFYYLKIVNFINPFYWVKRVIQEEVTASLMTEIYKCLIEIVAKEFANIYCGIDYTPIELPVPAAQTDEKNIADNPDADSGVQG